MTHAYYMQFEHLRPYGISDVTYHLLAFRQMATQFYPRQHYVFVTATTAFITLRHHTTFTMLY